MMWRVQMPNSEAFLRWQQRAEMVSRQPSWVLKAAIIAAVIVVVVPVVLLTLAAVTVGVAVFVLLALVSRVTSVLGGWFGGDGRSNVRVVRRQ